MCQVYSNCLSKVKIDVLLFKNNSEKTSVENQSEILYRLTLILLTSKIW